jgi:hypothetical protein
MSDEHELLAALRDLERLFANRVEVWRQTVEPDGTLGKRIYRCSFHRPRGAEPPTERKP